MNSKDMWRLVVDLTTQRDNARADARVLAHAFESDNRPPARLVARAMAYPVIPDPLPEQPADEITSTERVSRHG